jgi:hypothetical protein
MFEKKPALEAAADEGDFDSGSEAAAEEQEQPDNAELAMAIQDCKNCLIPHNLSPEYVDALWQVLQALAPQAIIHKRRSPVKTRPKLNFAKVNDDGSFPLYRWGQSHECYSLVQESPACLEPLFQLAGPGYNFLMMTFYMNGAAFDIPPHRDQAFSLASGSSAKEIGTEIYLLSLGATRCFCFSTLEANDDMRTLPQIKPHLVHSFDFQHGQLMKMTGRMNSCLKHSVPKQCEVTDLRVSIVLRQVDRDKVHVDNGWFQFHGVGKQYIKDEIGKNKGNKGQPRQFLRQAIPDTEFQALMDVMTSPTPCLA